MSQAAPIINFVYDRPDHTRRTLEALSQNTLAGKSTLYIFADGPKATATNEQLKNIDATRKVIREKQWCDKVVISEREENTGLGPSIVAGVGHVIDEHGTAIILEDDIVTSPGFLQYMNDALALYENEEQVMHISGYMYPLGKKLPETFFYNITTCWGWATWNRAWEHFNTDAAYLLQEIEAQNAVKRFNLDGKRAFTQQLEDNISGKIKTWAVKWQACVFLQNGLCLHPGQSLAQNIGHDGSGENCFETGVFLHHELADKVAVNPIPLEESKEVRELMKSFYSAQEPSLFQKMKGKLSPFIPQGIKNGLKKVF